MSHNLHKEKFLSLRQPAWHGLGLVIQDEIGAIEAGRRIQIPATWTEPVKTESGLPTGHKAIISRDPDGSAATVHTVVTDSYYEVLHENLLQIWDEEIHRPIETIGILGKGAGLFLTTKLPDFAVAGDEVTAYLMAENWLTGARANKVRKTPVRVVCQNTLMASDHGFISEVRICHTKSAIEQFRAALKNAMEQAIAEYDTVKEAFELLASTRLAEQEIKDAFSRVYPDIPQPKLQGAIADGDNLLKMAAWERENGAQVEHRNKVYGLYAGDGRGALSTAAKGTAWGGWNAVVEYEQYLKKFRRPESVVFGAGADRMDAAYSIFLETANSS